MTRLRCIIAAAFVLACQAPLLAQPIDTDAQPLASNAGRLLKALAFLGSELTDAETKAIAAAADKQDGRKLQELLDPHVMVMVHLNPEARVKAKRGPAAAVLQQGGYTPLLVKVHNESTVTKTLRLSSPQSQPMRRPSRSGVSACG